jgi:DNA polymerase
VIVRQITFAPVFENWQRAARQALQATIPPEAIHWQELMADQPALAMFDEMESSDLAPRAPAARVPKAFLESARRVACHRDPLRWTLLYRILWRLTHGEPRLLEISVDPDVDVLHRMDKAIRHDVHKMRAFVRFRAVPFDEASWYVAWFEPQHRIVELNAPFFIDRFAGMRWSILTPDRCAHWDGKQVTFTAGVSREAAPRNDDVEPLWLRYYANIFNPARVKTHAMQAEMPKHYWKNLPEAALIPALIREAPARAETMITRSQQQAEPPEEWQPAEPPNTRDLGKLRAAARHCTACPLFRHATQTVFGDGRPSADVVFVGEQPGDAEDLAGKPFIGPAGKLLDRALVEAGIDRKEVYVTNAVKHFKWEPRGKRRLHKTPNSRDIAACRPWLEAELAAIQPRVLVALGATATHTLLGNEVKVLRDRGKVMKSDFSEQTIVTVHPSSLLRAADEAARAAAYDLFMKDLRKIAELIHKR